MPELAPFAISLDSVSRRFGNQWALIRASFEIAAGSSLMLTGPNGSGKTTLLRCLATELRPHFGHIQINGQDLWASRNALRPDIAFVAHDTRLYDDLNAVENLALLASFRPTPADPLQWIDYVGLTAARHQPIREYSAGMRRRLALAVALMKQPRMLLLDEPFAALDTEGRGVVSEAVRTLKKSGTTVIIATHRPRVAAPSCDVSIHMANGQVCWQGTSEEALERGVAT